MKQPAIIQSLDGETATRRGLNRAQSVAETIKDWIIDRGLAPGDRLPQEPQLMAELGASKGTVREALKVLETQGLIRMRTGPGGGAFITDVGDDLASALLANHFFFKQVTIADIYRLRILLEPQLVEELAAHITDTQLDSLRDCMSTYRDPPASIEEEREQRAAELEFHEALAGMSKNPLLGFTCGFLARLLKDLAVCRRIYDKPNPELRESGLSYQELLIEALSAGDGARALVVMRDHMRTAQTIMLAQEAEITRAFLSVNQKP